MLKVEISKKDFCKETRIAEDNWIFDKVGKNPKFYRKRYEKWIDEPTIYGFDDNVGTVHEFKYMDEYKETWTRKIDYPEPQIWSLWSTWKVW